MKIIEFLLSIFTFLFLCINFVKGTNDDPAQWWNLAGVIHWNDWKPITGIF